MGIKNLTEAEEKEFYRLVEKMNGEKPDKEQGVKVRKPRQSEEYFCISNDGAVIQSRWTNDSLDEGRWELGNVFFTEESAWLAREKRKVEVELERYAKEHNDPTLEIVISFCMMNTMKNLIMMCGPITDHRERWYSHQNNLYLMQSKQ